MRKQEADANAANHDNRSLTSKVKQFTGDEMGTTRKGRSHLCFITHPFFPAPFSVDLNLRKLHLVKLNINYRLIIFQYLFSFYL